MTLQKYGYFYGYNSSVNPSIANSFASAAFRFGHSLVNSKLSRCDKFGNHMNFGEWLDISWILGRIVRCQSDYLMIVGYSFLRMRIRTLDNMLS